MDILPTFAAMADRVLRIAPPITVSDVNRPGLALAGKPGKPNLHSRRKSGTRRRDSKAKPRAFRTVIRNPIHLTGFNKGQ